MARTVLMSGATGALGPHLLAELLRSRDIDRIFVVMRPGPTGIQDRARSVEAAVSRIARESNASAPAPGIGRLRFLAGDISRHDLGLNRRDADVLLHATDTIVHAAASTSFGASIDCLRAANVGGTHNAVQFARQCRSLTQFLLVSTVCVAGTRTGSIDECLDEERPAFVNAYEETKWESERLTAASDLPLRIGRLSICLGGQASGYVHRFGAVHHALHWLMRGLIPMIPGAPESPIDVIANDVAARWIARAAVTPVDGLEVCHVAAGPGAPSLGDLVEAAIACFIAGGDRSGRVIRPVFVDRETFDLFRRSVEQSGDVLFTRVLASTRAFLPVLAYPKVYRTERAERCWGGPLPHPEWRSVLEKVIQFGCVQGWTDARGEEAAHV